MSLVLQYFNFFPFGVNKGIKKGRSIYLYVQSISALYIFLLLSFLGQNWNKDCTFMEFLFIKNNQYKPFYFLFTAVILLMVCLHMWQHFFNVDFFRDQQILWHYQTQNPVDCISYSLWWTGNFCHRKTRFGRAKGGKRKVYIFNCVISGNNSTQPCVSVECIILI